LKAVYNYILPAILISAVLFFAIIISKESYFFLSKADRATSNKIEQIQLSAIYTGNIHKNGSLYTELLHQEVPELAVAKITNKFSELFDLTNSHPGDEFKLFLSPGDSILAFEYITNDLKKYRLEKVDDKYTNQIINIDLDKKIEFVGGLIETNLWDAIINQLPDAELFTRITDIYAWEIDFLTESRAGDTFKMIYETLFKDGKFIKCGDILAVEYNLSGTRHQAFLYTDPSGYTDYYDENGYSIRRELIKSPLNYPRVSSGYSMRRLHPIFKIYRPHLGVDYAAPIGTPVVAAGDGIIKVKDWINGFGNYIEIQHDFGLSTGYGHLSGFAQGIVKNRRVRQGQLIGFVGSTGISTGPHLDYRVRKNKRYVNPLKMTVPASPPLKMENKNEFLKIVFERQMILDRPIEPRLLVSNQKLALQ